MITVNTIFKNKNNFCKIKINKKDDINAYGIIVGGFKNKINFRIKEMMYSYDYALNPIIKIQDKYKGNYGVYMYYDIKSNMPIYFGIYSKNKNNNRPVNITGHSEVYYNYIDNFNGLAILKVCDNCSECIAKEIETFLINKHTYTLNKKASTKRILEHNIALNISNLIK